MRILYTKIDGNIFNPCACAKLTPKENDLITSGVWGILEVDEVTHVHVKAGHCVVQAGEVVILPEDVWEENQPDQREEF